MTGLKRGEAEIMITEKDLKFILQEGEGYKIEFKENLSNLG
jgi:hypothetical protein